MSEQAVIINLHHAQLLQWMPKIMCNFKDITCSYWKADIWHDTT